MRNQRLSITVALRSWQDAGKKVLKSKVIMEEKYFVFGIISKVEL
jgi:hypothetical protein